MMKSMLFAAASLALIANWQAQGFLNLPNQLYKRVFNGKPDDQYVQFAMFDDLMKLKEMVAGAQNIDEARKTRIEELAAIIDQHNFDCNELDTKVRIMDNTKVFYRDHTKYSKNVARLIEISIVPVIQVCYDAYMDRYLHYVQSFAQQNPLGAQLVPKFLEQYLHISLARYRDWSWLITPQTVTLGLINYIEQAQLATQRERLKVYDNFERDCDTIRAFFEPVASVARDFMSEYQRLSFRMPLEVAQWVRVNEVCHKVHEAPIIKHFVARHFEQPEASSSDQ